MRNLKRKSVNKNRRESRPRRAASRASPRAQHTHLDLRNTLAEIMFPAEWAEFNRRNGLVENMVGWELKKSLTLSTAVVEYLRDANLLHPDKFTA